MTIEIVIPSPLRKYTSNQKRVYCNANSIEVAFSELKLISQPLVDSLLDENGSIREFIKVFVNRSDISNQEGLKTPLKSGDVVSIVPAFAGG